MTSRPLWFGCLAVYLSAFFYMTWEDFSWENATGLSRVITTDTGLRFVERGLVASQPSIPSLNESSFRNGQFRVDVKVTPSEAAQAGVIVTHSRNLRHPNWTISQKGRELQVDHRGRVARFGGVFSGSGLAHFSVCFFGQEATLRLGKRKETVRLDRDNKAWDPKAPLVLGNTLDGDHPWIGEIEELRLAGEQRDSECSGQEEARSERVKVIDLVLVRGGPRLVENGGADPVELSAVSWPWSLKLRKMLSADYISAKFGVADTLANLALTWPLGVILAFALGRMRSAWSVILTVCIALLLSLAVELSQFFSSVRVASVLDLILNVLGAYVGLLTVHSIIRARSGHLCLIDPNGEDRNRAA